MGDGNAFRSSEVNVARGSCTGAMKERDGAPLEVIGEVDWYNDAFQT